MDVREEVKGEEIEDLRNSDVVAKYKKAAEICNGALALVVKELAAGKKIVDLCEMGDKYILEETGKIYNKNGKDKKPIEKGISFPTCISVNNVVGHFSPLADNTDVLAEGDMVKIDLGSYIDGYAAVGAHTVVIPKTGAADDTITGRQADVLMAAHAASEAVLRLLRPGTKNTKVTEVIAKIAKDFNVNPVQGVLSHEMTRFVMDGENVIINRTEIDQKVDEIEFAPNQVWAIDIVMCSGDGKPKEVDDRVTVYKRAVETTYMLKGKLSREVLSDINKRFPTFPFTIRAFDEKKVLFGIKECFEHNLVHRFPILHEKAGETVAHFKFTALITANGTIKVTGLPADPSKWSSTHSVEDAEVKALLSSSTSSNSKKNAKKKAAKAKKAGAPDLVDGEMDTTQ